MPVSKANAGPTDAERASWAFRYAPHLGYRSTEAPLLRHTAPSVSPVDQAAHAARLQFAGVQYPWAASRPQEERAELAITLAAHGLACGCVVWSSRETLRAPYWVRDDGPARGNLTSNLQRAMDAASELGSAIIAVLGAWDDDAGSSAERQRDAMAENLRLAGDMATARSMVIGLEPMIALPGLVLKSCHDGLEMIARTGHPAVQLIFDTGHVHDVDEDVGAALAVAFDDVCLVQFADQPGRVEPGAGTIDFRGIMLLLKERGYTGLIELEHGWRLESPEGERQGLDRLRSLDLMTIR